MLKTWTGSRGVPVQVQGGVLPLQGAVGPRGRARVDVELVLVLEGLELVRVPRDEDVHVQLPLQQRQAGHVAPWHHLVAVDETDLKLAHRHHLLLRVVQVLRERNGLKPLLEHLKVQFISSNYYFYYQFKLCTQ